MFRIPLKKKTHHSLHKYIDFQVLKNIFSNRYTIGYINKKIYTEIEIQTKRKTQKKYIIKKFNNSLRFRSYIAGYIVIRQVEDIQIDRYRDREIDRYCRNIARKMVLDSLRVKMRYILNVRQKVKSILRKINIKINWKIIRKMIQRERER